jgi:23S rRNA (guanosine2251-2'-O)-methyltransferase
VLAALGNPKRRLRRLLATSETATALPPNLPLPAEIMGPEKIAQALPREAVHQGLALLADALPGRALADCAELAEPAFLIALDQVTDPHNVGAILRSAAAFGAQGVILTERHAPGTGGVLAKAASGALEHVPLIRVVNLAQTLAVLKEWGYAIVGLAEDGTLNIAQLPPSRRTVLVLGAEGEGLRRLTRERCDVLVKLPTQGPIASLNVSNAAAVALYALKEKGA